MTLAVFAADGDRFLPSPIARAGWYDDALHGGPVAALFARQIEGVPTLTPMRVVRLTVDLMRPVPMAPLTVRTETVRSGRRIQVVDAVMEAGETTVARASALLVRVADHPVPEHHRRDRIPGPDGLDDYEMREANGEWFHTSAVIARFVSGDFYRPGPATVWLRLAVALIEGEEPSPLQSVAAFADFGNGLSRVLPHGWLFINADLTVHLHRHPAGPWVCLRSRTDAEGDGIGLAQSELFDQQGAIGHAVQGLVVEPI